MPFTKEEKKVLREKLPRGYSRTLATQFGLDAKHIRNILGGSANNDSVVIAAFELAEKHNAGLEKTKSALTA